MARHLDSAVVDTICSEYSKGVSQTALASRYHTTRRTIRRGLEKRGIRNWGNHVRLTEEEQGAIVADHRRGVTSNVLRVRAGCSLATLCKILLRHGVASRVGGLGQEKGTTRRSEKRPNTRDLEWAAGFLEGEGCFTVRKRSQRIHAPQVNYEPVGRLLEVFGGTMELRRPTPTHPHYQDQHCWHVSGSRARGVMMTLYALMSAKRQAQIRAALGRT